MKYNFPVFLMNRLLVIISAVILCTITVFPQEYSITGQVFDEATKEAIPSANVLVKGRESSALPLGDATSKAGKFSVNNLKPGKYSVKISFIGYASYKASVEIIQNSIDLGKIYLKQGSVETEEVTVTDKAIPVVVNGDTTEYNSNAFKTNKDADAEELVKKMPGITVQDGTVKAQGEEVKKVTVDGRQFFGSDPRATLKNIPAEMVDKIQVFDEKGEQAQFTGFDDGNTNKTMNIVTRTEFRNGTFGKLSAAYGTEESYRATGNINFFNDKQRISVVTQFNNLSEQNFAIDDLMGIMSSQMGGRGGGMGGMGGGMSRSSGGMRGGPASNFLVGNSSGLSSTKAFGVNYSDLWWNKLDINGSYFFNRTDNDAETITKRDYFITDGEAQKYNGQSTSSSANTNHRFNLRVDYDIDSSNSILFTPSASFQLNDRYSKSVGQTTTDLSLLNFASNLYNSDMTAYNASAELLYRHRFDTKGRTFSVSVSPTANKNYGSTDQFSENIYYNTEILYDTTDQVSDPNVKGIGTSTSIVYTEPLTDNSQLQFDWKYDYEEDKSDKNVYALSDGYSYSQLDTSLSSFYTKISRIQAYGTGYNLKLDNYFVTANVDYNITRLNGDQMFPYNSKIEKYYYSILPSFNIRYRKQRDLHWGFFYRTSNTTPEISQLQEVLDNSNTLYLSIGNPNLKQDYRHTFMMRFMRMNFLTMESFFFNLSGTIINDYRANNTIIATKDTVVNNIDLQSGSQLTMPVNLNGYYNAQANAMYGLPLSFVPSNLNFNGSVGYTRTPAITNSVVNYTNTYTAGLGMMWSSNFSEELDVTLSYNGTYNYAKNKTTAVKNSDYYNQNAKFTCYWTFLESIVLQTELSYQHYGNLSSEYNNDPVSWDFSLGKKLFSNNRGEVRFTAHDILNQSTNIQQNTTSTYTESTETNNIGRYYLVSFIYNIKMF